MVPKNRFDPLERFAEIELLAAKVYFRFSHLFLRHPDLRDFWWQMGMDEEQHSSILLACKEIIKHSPHEAVDPSITQQKADKFKAQLTAYLRKGTPSITMEKAFEIAVEIESSELDFVYSQLLHSCGPMVAKTMENLSIPARVQRAKLKNAILRFTMEPKLRAAAQTL